jgi:hypothetical protein
MSAVVEGAEPYLSAADEYARVQAAVGSVVGAPSSAAAAVVRPAAPGAAIELRAAVDSFAPASRDSLLGRAHALSTYVPATLLVLACAFLARALVALVVRYRRDCTAPRRAPVAVDRRTLRALAKSRLE